MSKPSKQKKPPAGDPPPNDATLSPTTSHQVKRSDLEYELTWAIAAELAWGQFEIPEAVDDAFEIFDACKRVSWTKGIPLSVLMKAAVGFYIAGDRKNSAYAVEKAVDLHEACQERHKARAHFAKYASIHVQREYGSGY